MALSLSRGFLHLLRNVSFKRQSSTASNINLSGIFPPIVTPFNNDESIAWKELEKNISKLNQFDLKGYLVQGSNGEYCFLTSHERLEMVRKIKPMVGENKLLLAGSGCESTRETIELSQKMADVGADALVVITPSYFKSSMTSSALLRHFEDVANHVPVPVILYNVPKNTGVDMDWKVAVKMADHPNVIGMKESNGDVAKIGKIVHETRNISFQVLAGSAGFLLPALHVGAIGGVCALANVLPDEVCSLQHLYEAGHFQEASHLQRRLIVPNAAVTQEYGVPGLKRAMEWFGFHGGSCRKPLLPLSDFQTSQLRDAFSRDGFLA